MEPAGPELVQTWRDEAIAFFHVNQAARTAAERVFALIFSVTAIAGSVGAASNTDDVAIPLPTVILLLLSYMFQQYADLTAIGTARRRLEDLVNDAVGGKGLIYETAVAEVRKTRPLVHSVRLLQGMMALVVVGATAFAIMVAFDGQDTIVEVAFGVGTTLAAASAWLSFWHMRQSPHLTKDIMDKRELPADQLVWLRRSTYSDAVAQALPDELETETFERLVRAGLKAETSPDPLQRDADP